jgi:TPR repeat protein
MIRDGYGVPRNLTRARVWLEKAAKAGDLEAKAELASMPDAPLQSAPPAKK